MDAVMNAVGRFGFSNAIWVFLVLFAVHELEEWNIARFEKANFADVPPLVTDRNARAWILTVIAIGAVWCALATLWGNAVAAVWIFLPAVAVVLMNAGQHIVWSLHFRKYAPGLITAVVVLIPAGTVFIVWSVWSGYAPWWYAAFWLALALVGLVQTVRAGGRATPFIHAIYRIGSIVAGLGRTGRK